MKRLPIPTVAVLIALAVLAISVTIAGAGSTHSIAAGQGSPALKPNACTTIQDGTLLTSDGVVITTGYDQWGYNYLAHMFNGMYCNAYRDAAWCQPYKDDSLIMKWNDAWLSNKDCDGDGLLDRYYGFDGYVGSGAWLTNHMSGSYVDEDGEIVAAPADATLAGGVWYSAGGTEMGPAIWGEFAIIQEVYDDPCGGFHGVLYLSPDHAGLGGW
jgi:hypothetical protein